jgi:hypothetical protein
MSIEISKREFKKDIFLLLIGAMLASIPTLISTYMQGESQLHQIILDRRITSLKEYSETYNRLVNNLLPRVQTLEDRVIYLHDNYLNKKKINKDVLLTVYKDFRELIILNETWKADINTQTLIINSLFNMGLPNYDIYYFDPLKTELEEKSELKRFEEMKENIIKIKKNIVDDINYQQQIMRQLSVIVNSN